MTKILATDTDEEADKDQLLERLGVDWRDSPKQKKYRD